MYLLWTEIFNRRGTKISHDKIWTTFIKGVPYNTINVGIIMIRRWKKLNEVYDKHKNRIKEIHERFII